MADDQSQDSLDPGSQGGDPVSPDAEAQMAFSTSQGAAQQRGQAQAAFDTLRMRRAFVNGLLTAKGSAAQGRAFRESSLGQNLEGAPPASQTS